MIRKWTVVFSPQTKKRISEDFVWRKSKGLAKAVQLPCHFMSRLLPGQLSDGVSLKDDETKWGRGLAKCMNGGWSENEEFLDAFRRGRRMTACVDGNIPEGGARVTLRFYGKSMDGRDVSWELVAVFTEDGDLGGLQNGGGEFPTKWATSS